MTARRESPRDDLLSELASHIVDDGDEPGAGQITVLEALDVCNQLLVAGNETTTHISAISWSCSGSIPTFSARSGLIARCCQISSRRLFA